MTLQQLLPKMSSYLRTEVKRIKNSQKIKTDERRKKALVEVWNRTIDAGYDLATGQFGKACIKTYYGIITANILSMVTMDEAYMIVDKWIDIMEGK